MAVLDTLTVLVKIPKRPLSLGAATASATTRRKAITVTIKTCPLDAETCSVNTGSLAAQIPIKAPLTHTGVLTSYILQIRKAIRP